MTARRPIRARRPPNRPPTPYGETAEEHPKSVGKLAYSGLAPPCDRLALVDLDTGRKRWDMKL